jgi:hypothetical protein
MRITFNTNKSIFRPKYPEKYIGNVNNIVIRFSWENSVAMLLDSHPSVLRWSSEVLKIAYYNPVLKKHTVYIRDFFVAWIKSDGKQCVE